MFTCRITFTWALLLKKGRLFEVQRDQKASFERLEERPHCLVVAIKALKIILGRLWRVLFTWVTKPQTYFWDLTSLLFRSPALKNSSKIRAEIGLRATLGIFLLHQNSSLSNLIFGYILPKYYLNDLSGYLWSP